MTDPAALLTRLEQANQSRDVWEIALAEQALENAAPDLAAHVTELTALLEQATKGPWTAIGTDPAEGVDCFWIKAQPNASMRGFTKEIGSVNGSQNDPVQQANARLIALAPDLAARVLELDTENALLRAENALLRDLMTKAESEQCASCRHCDSFGFRAALTSKGEG